MADSKTINVSFDLVDNSPEVLAAFRQQLDAGLKACGMFGSTEAAKIAEAKQIRDTGNLINSISYYHADFSNETLIGAGVDYAIYQELGTSRQRARPFIKPAVADNADEYKRLIESALKA